MEAECTECRGRFSEYLDGELAAEDRAWFEGHVSACAECRRELEAWRQTVQAAADLPLRKPRRGFADRVADRIRAEGSVAPAPIVHVLWTRLLPVAALFLLMVGITLGVRRNGLFGFGRGARDLAMATRHTARAGEAVADLERADQALPAGPAEEVGETVERLVEVAAAERKEKADDLRVLGTVLEDEEPAAPLAEAASYEDALAEVPAPAAPGRREIAAGFYDYGEDARAVGLERDDDGKAAFGRRVEVGDKGMLARDVAPAPTEAEKATEPALTWRVPARATAVGVERGRAGRLVFNQAFQQEAAQVAGPVQQVLTLVGDSPADLARQAVTVANENGVAAALIFDETGTEGQLEIYLNVPAAQHESLLRQLAALAPPETQALSNTIVATGKFFEITQSNYDAYRLSLVRANQAAVGKAGRARLRVTTAQPFSEVSRRVVAEKEASAAPADEDAADKNEVAVRHDEPVNLLIRIARPVVRATAGQ